MAPIPYSRGGRRWTGAWTIAWTMMIHLAAGLTLAGAAFAQELPPGVLLLSRIKRHVKEQLQRLPNVTCLETVHREHQVARGRMRPLDTVRLEVLTDGDKELFASPDDRNFSERPPISYVGSGTLGDGFFGLYLRTILLGATVSFIYKGEEEIGGRNLTRWDYQLPLMWSGQTIRLEEGTGRVSLHGRFWADPRTDDVVRLEVNAGDFPPSLPLTGAAWSIDYARNDLGGELAVLMPQSAEFRMARFSGETSHNRLEFTQCRVFGARTTIDFDAPDSASATKDEPPRFGVAAIDDTLRPLPPGLQITVQLRSRISGDVAVGELIDGMVAGNVMAKGAVMIAAGAPVRGRIRRLERYTEPLPHFVIAVEFTEVELHGIRHRFDADLARIDPAAGVEQTLSVPGPAAAMNTGRIQEFSAIRETLVLPDLPGVATFFLRGARLDLPPGLRTVWTTRTPGAGSGSGKPARTSSFRGTGILPGKYEQRQHSRLL